MHDEVATMLRRVRLLELDDAKGQQQARVRGLAGETLSEVMHVGRFGFSSNPPAGSEALLLALGGRTDRALLMGMEDPRLRPTAREGGSTAIYDANGNLVSLVQAEVRIKSPQKIVFEVGSTTVTIDGNGVTINGTRVEHDGRNIGKDHTHGGIVPGGADTDIPNP